MLNDLGYNLPLSTNVDNGLVVDFQRQTNYLRSELSVKELSWISNQLTASALTHKMKRGLTELERKTPSDSERV